MPDTTVSEARLLGLLDTAVDGIIVIDAQARILVFNKACERMFGYVPAEMLGRNVKAIMPSEYAREHDRYIADYIRTGVRRIIGIGREVNGRHKDGTTFPIELSVGEAMTPAGRQYVGILRDLRPRRDADQRFTQLQGDLLRMARVSAMDEMGAALAHELNQPLTALMLYLQACARSIERETGDWALSAPTVAILDKAMREAERAGNIVQRMRQFIEKRDPQRRLVDLNPLVEDAVVLTLLGSPPGTRIERDLADDLPPVLADPVQIQQVVVNLVRNAFDAVERHQVPRVGVTTRHAEGAILVTIEDNGPGISSEVLPDLFRAFASSKGSGLGVGLAISRTIAQNHGGNLSVDPGGNGRGARFTLRLPLATDVDGASGRIPDAANPEGAQ